MPDAVTAVRQAFVDLAAGHFEQPVRTVLADGAFPVMSAHHRPSSTTIVKTLSVGPHRQPTICGAITWLDPRHPVTLIADAQLLTSLRTGAVAGVATDLLAAPDARRLTLIGTGAQALHQILGVHAVRRLARVTVVGRSLDRARLLAGRAAAELPEVRIEATDQTAAAIADADIISCATSATAPLFGLDQLPDRVHVNAIGSYRPSMRELPDELLADATVIVDDLAAAVTEAGEIIHAIRAGAIAATHLGELGAALTAPPAATLSRTVFKSVGVAAPDWALARLLAERFLPSAP